MWNVVRRSFLLRMINSTIQIKDIQTNLRDVQTVVEHDVCDIMKEDQADMEAGPDSCTQSSAISVVKTRKYPSYPEAIVRCIAAIVTAPNGVVPGIKVLGLSFKS